MLSKIVRNGAAIAAVTLALVGVLSVACSAASEDTVKSAWWLSMGSLAASASVALFASTIIASSLSRASRELAIIDEISTSIIGATDRLLEAARLRAHDAKALSAAVTHASELSKSVTLLGKCDVPQRLYDGVKRSALRMKQKTTNSKINNAYIEDAEREGNLIGKTLLRIRLGR